MTDRSSKINTSLTTQQRLLHYFDHYDREHPGEFATAERAIAALDGLDEHSALQELRLLGRDGHLELVGAPIGAVHAGTEARITNRGRKAEESAADRDARHSVLHYIAAHAAERPTRLDAAPQALHLSERETYRALISLAASGLITHKRDGQGLGLVQITPRGQTKTAPVVE